MLKRRNVRHFLAKLLLVTILLGNMESGYLANTWVTSAQVFASGVQVQTPSDADKPDPEMSSDDVTPDRQNRLSENSYLRENPEASPSIASPSESGIEKETVKITAADVVVSLGSSGFDLLDGVTARAEAEDGDSVPVKVRDDGGFDINTEGIYTVEYEAESVTATRNVTVFAFDPQPATLAEVQVMVDAYETEYQVAMDEGGFLSALEVQKPRWQYEVASSLMASGWRCDYLEDETYGVTYWSFFPAPAAMSAEAAVGNYTEFKAAFDNPEKSVIVLTADIDFGNESRTLTRNLTIKSDPSAASTYMMRITADNRHFIVDGSGAVLSLENVIVEGRNPSNNWYGGIVVKNGAELNVKDSAIQRCMTSGNPSNGGGIHASGNSKVNIFGGSIIRYNYAYFGAGGGVYLEDSTINVSEDTMFMSNRAYRSSTVSGDGGGIYAVRSEVNIGDSVGFTSNTADGNGGGLYAYDCTTTIGNGSQVTFTGNKASWGNGGGGIYQYYGTLNIGGGTAFLGNTTEALSGAGVYARRTGMNIEGTDGNPVVFRDGSANSCGGAICIIEGNSVTIQYAEFYNNKANNFGGAIDIDGSAAANTVEMENCIFSGNVCNSTGGAIAIEVNTNDVTIRDTVIDGNVAGGAPHNTGYRSANGNGGGIYFENGTLTIADSEIINNQSPKHGGGIGGNNMSNLLNSLTVTNTVMNGNIASVFYKMTNQTYIDLHAQRINNGSEPSYKVYSWGKDWAYNNFDIQYSDTDTEAMALTVKFDSRGGSPTPSDITGIVYNDGIEAPAETPSKTGYTFAGWENATGELWTFKTASNLGAPVRSDMTLYARWDRCLVSFISDGVVIDTQTVATGNTVSPTTVNVSKEGHNFNYWADENGKRWFFSTKVTQDMNLYAVWAPNPYTVLFLKEKDDINSVYDTQIVLYDNYSSNPGIPVKTGYTFDGWLDENDNSWNFSTQIKRDTVLHAKWKAMDHTVRFYLDDTMQSGVLYDIKTAAYNTTLQNNMPSIPIQAGQYFGGWLLPDGTVFDELTRITGDIDVYAVWSNQPVFALENVQYLEFAVSDKNPFVDRSVSWSNFETMLQAVVKNVSTDIPIPESYVITSSDYSQVDYNEITQRGAEYLVHLTAAWVDSTDGQTKTCTGTVKVYVYDAVSPVIDVAIPSFTIDQNTNPTDAAALLQMAGVSVTDNYYSRDGITLDTVFANGSLELIHQLVPGTYRVDLGAVDGSGNRAVGKFITVTIIPITYTVTYDSNGGSFVDSRTVNYGDTITAPINPTRASDTFGGWYKDNGTFLKAWNFGSDIVTENITLYAKWKNNSSGGSSGGGGGTPNIPTTPTTPAPPDQDIPAETEAPIIAPPTVPPGHSIVPRNEREYVEIDENGIPIGIWRMSDDNSTWIPDEYIPPTGLPKTGDNRSEAWILLLFSCISFCGVYFSGRAERNKSGRQKDE